MLHSQYTAIPTAMREARRWLVWTSIPSKGGKARKVPRYASGAQRNGKLDSPADLAQLVTFDTALAALASSDMYAGLGFALGPDGTGNYWQGVDLDNVPDRPGLQTLAACLPGYREKSPSGRGFHSIGYGKEFNTYGSNHTGAEAYARGRFFTVTGMDGAGEPECIEWWVNQLLAPAHSPSQVPLPGAISVSVRPIFGQQPLPPGAMPHPTSPLARSGSPSPVTMFIPEGTIDDLRSALTSLPADDRDKWVAVGQNLKGLADRGRELWIEWSRKSPQWQDGDEARWETFDGSQSDYRAVFAKAQRAGWINPASRATTGCVPEPLPTPLPPVPAFNPSLLPTSIREWCVDTADGLQVPLDFTAVPAMVALAGALGRRVGIAMKQHDRWHELPMLWGCVIGRPSSGKSPALHPARRMLERLTAEERKSYEAEQREYEGRRLITEASKAYAKKLIQEALRKGDTTAAESAAESALFDEEPPVEPRIVVNDATVEKLGELLNTNPRGLVQFRDELAGWLANLDREGREGDRAFWLECWNGSGTFTVDRIGRGTVRIDACAVSILGGMQPGKLAEYVRGAIRGGFSDDGLIQRFQMAVYPDLPANWSYCDRPADPASEARAWATFQRLRALDPDAIGAERAEGIDVPFLRFDDEAQGLLIEWTTKLMQRLRAGDEPAWMESHLSKYRALAGRLALVLHLADGGTGRIGGDTLATALEWCDYLEGHARRIYAPAMDNGLGAAHLILKRRAQLGDTFTPRDIQRRNWAGLSDRDTIAEGLELLVEHHHLAATVEPTGGRPSTVYAWRASA